MRYRNPNLRERSRKFVIPIFIGLHFTALVLWILPPYAGMVSHSPLTHSFFGKLERSLFERIDAPNGSLRSTLVQNYVDTIGGHQYWDFFAPPIPRTHRYLSVCTDIRLSGTRPQIDCIKPVYQSFEGQRADAVRPHRGERSRAFRLVENLLRLNRPDLFEAFTAYWRKQQDPQPEQTFLVLHEFTLRPGQADHAGIDRLIWLYPE